MNEITIKDGKVVARREKNENGVLHNIFIIDASGSMNQRSNVDGRLVSKYDTALAGVNAEIATLKKDDQGDVRLTVIEFDSADRNTERITEHYVGTPLKDVGTVNFRGASGNTPLYQTIGYVIEKFLRIASNKDTVLIKIFTDGAHNCYWGKYDERECKALIKDAKENRDFIISFIGTEFDTETVIQSLGVERGSTFTYDGTAKGMGETMFMVSSATVDTLSDRRSGKDLKSKVSYFNNTSGTTQVDPQSPVTDNTISTN